jgi:hypothetical protein
MSGSQPCILAGELRLVRSMILSILGRVCSVQGCVGLLCAAWQGHLLDLQ